jgi:hypothetical protein
MTLQHRALPLLTSTPSSRYLLFRSCALTGGFRRMATDSGANIVRAIYPTHLRSLNTLAVVPEKNTVV